MPMAVDIIQSGVHKNDRNVENEESATSSEEKSTSEVKEVHQHQSTQYEKLCEELSHDERCIKELTLGKRIGFYRIRNDIGSGNFAKVKLGFHCLVKGTSKTSIQPPISPKPILHLL